MLRVGLTGGVGAGKSTAARRLETLGAVVLDADAIAREVVAPGTAGLAEVLEAFGTDVLDDTGALDRPTLAQRVFAADDGGAARRRLEAITHPRIAERTEELLAAVPPDAVVVHDIPLLVELHRGSGYHLVVVVGADAGVRVERLVTGRGMTEAAARARVAAQASDDERRAAADVWLDNSASPAALETAVEELWHERLLPFEANLRSGTRAPRPTAPVLVQADPGWAAAGERVAARVRRAAGNRAVDVQHTGSTSVPGLDAKDTIDLQVVVADLPTAHALGADLAAAGLVVAGDRWWDEPVALHGGRVPKVFAANADPARPVNCHVRDAANPAAEEVIAFRDRLRDDPSTRDAYAALKHDLAARHADTEEYAAAKTPFIASVLGL